MTSLKTPSKKCSHLLPTQHIGDELDVRSTISGKYSHGSTVTTSRDKATRIAQVGSLKSFDESTSDWTAYEERLQSYLNVNRIEDDNKVDAVVSIIGPKTYALLKSLKSPDAPSKKKFKEILQLLREHYTPKPSVIGERAKFHRRTQLDGESIKDFAAALRKLAETCNFGAFLDESLRDRFVCGLQRVEIQRVLFTEDKNLTFQKAIDKAQALESATRNATATHAKEDSTEGLLQMKESNLTVFKVRIHQTRIASVPVLIGCLFPL
ncbi:uncharacterized protein LOC135376521 [Ornithodoros turicata]|uniref:uncharacterized protein LOC135376521 n=1 Tax=Ornithodoros turicata TaxID=34597 RepID=UPI003139FD5C